MSRQGFPPAKAGLYIWTMQLIRIGNNPVAEAFQKRKARGQRYAIQEARGKLCAILHGIARTGTPYQP